MGIWAKTAGMVMKTSEGPADGAKPKVNTAGKMAMPANMETHKSAHMTRNAVRGMYLVIPEITAIRHHRAHADGQAHSRPERGR